MKLVNPPFRGVGWVEKIEKNELLVCLSGLPEESVYVCFSLKSVLYYNFNVGCFISHIHILAQTRHSSALLLTVLLTPHVHSVVERETKAQTSE